MDNSVAHNDEHAPRLQNVLKAFEDHDPSLAKVMAAFVNVVQFNSTDIGALRDRIDKLEQRPDLKWSTESARV